MLKKFGWIVALLVVFSMVFIGCGDDRKAVIVDIEAPGIEVSCVQSWGNGIDIIHTYNPEAADDPQTGKAEIKFEAGDVLYAKVALAGSTPGTLLFATTPGGWGALGGGADWANLTASNSEAEMTWTLTAENVAAIVGNPNADQHKAVRLRTDNGQVFKYYVFELKVTRGTTVLFSLADYLEKALDDEVLTMGETDNDKIYPASVPLVAAGGNHRVIGPGAGDTPPICFCENGKVDGDACPQGCCDFDCTDSTCTACELEVTTEQQTAFNSATAAANLNFVSLWGEDRSITFADGVFERVTGKGSCFFSIDTGLKAEVDALLAEDGDGWIVVDYITIVTKPNAELTWKSAAENASDLEYIGLRIGTGALRLALSDFPASYDFSKLYFQDNSSNLANWKMKITSIVLEEAGIEPFSFELDLEDFIADAFVVGGPAGGSNPGVNPETSFDDGKLTVEVDVLHQAVVIALSTEQKAKVVEVFLAGESVNVEITGSASKTVNTRFGFRDPTTGAGWNGSTLPNGEFGTTAATVSGTLSEANGSGTSTALLNSFMIQTIAEPDFTLEITSIKISYGNTLTISDKDPDGETCSETDLAIGKGWITGSDFDKVMAASGKSLEFTVTAGAGGAISQGWAGKVCLNPNDSGNEYPLDVPAITSGNSEIVTIPVNAAFIDHFKSNGGLFINLWAANATVTKVEIVD